jgi:hypothetical protein
MLIVTNKPSMLNVIMMKLVLRSVTIKPIYGDFYYAECCYGECPYAEYCYDECRYAKCRGTINVSNFQHFELKKNLEGLLCS